MTNHIGGTVVMPWPKSQPGRMNHDEYEVFKAFVAPDGSKWISEGIYKQAKDLEKSESLVEKLQAQIADLQFPISGMSATITPHSVDVWKTGGDSDDSVSFFLKHKCDFCEKDALTLNIANDYMSLFVCRPCIVSMFTGAEILAK